MKILHTSFNVFLQALITSAFIGVFIYSLTGTPTVPVTIPVGDLYLSETEFGLSLFQSTKHASYFMNAYNDYYIDREGKRTAFIPLGDQRKLITTAKPNTTEKIVRQVNAYFGNYEIASEFGNSFKMRYFADVANQTIRVTRRISLYPQVITAAKIGTTLTYSRDDFVFDETGALYTENTDSNRELLERVAGIDLTPHDSSVRRPAAGRKIYVVNPRIGVVLMLTAADKQEVFVNKDYKIIELEEKNPGQNQSVITTGMTIQVLPDMRNIKSTSEESWLLPREAVQPATVRG